jgi:hypothetical protein
MVQSLLTGFEKKSVSMGEFNRQSGFRRWNNLIYFWDVKYQGYQRAEDGGKEGYVHFHVKTEIIEALVKSKIRKGRKKVMLPGYKFIIIQDMVFPGNNREKLVAYEQSFQKNQLRDAFDVFQREIMNIQAWIRIAESRARFIPKKMDVFECPFCGWVTDSCNDDISCCGCGKRFWSEKLWNGFSNN